LRAGGRQQRRQTCKRYLAIRKLVIMNRVGISCRMHETHVLASLAVFRACSTFRAQGPSRVCAQLESHAAVLRDEVALLEMQAADKRQAGLVSLPPARCA
jgi:hypothetical protein